MSDLFALNELNELNELNVKCAICERHSINRYNCCHEDVLSDLDYLCSNISSSSNRISEYNFVEEITNILSNIKEHFEFTNEEIICLFADTLIQYRLQYNNPNKYIQLHKLVHTNLCSEYCAICLQDVNISKTVKFNCNHIFCGNCVINDLKYHKNAKKLECYLCRNDVIDISIYDNNIYCDLKDKLNELHPQNNESNIN